MLKDYLIKNFKIIILIVLLLYGGDNLFAQVKKVYKVEATNVTTKVNTVFYVLAIDAEQAGEQVALNGWKPINVELAGINKAFFKENTPQADSPKLKYILTVYFEPCKYSTVLDNETVKILKGLNEKSEYIIYGHTDSTPAMKKDDFNNNYELSLKRASFLKSFIISITNIQADKIKIVGLGEFYPLVDNEVDGALLNRRAELYERY